jgi:hypothetical protein
MLSTVVRAQDDPMAWFPLRVGARWAYEHEWRSGDRRRPNVERWTTEESITGWVTIPEGLVVLRAVQQQSEDSGRMVTHRVLGLDGRLREGSYVVAHDREPYLLRASCVYVLDNGFDGQSDQLRPNYRKDLADGAISPEFCFPLEAGRHWGNTDIPWRVEPIGEGAGALSPAEYTDAIHIVSDHFGSGGRKDVWFKKGVGVAGEHYTHSGSYDEYTKKLLSFSH